MSGCTVQLNEQHKDTRPALINRLERHKAGPNQSTGAEQGRFQSTDLTDTRPASMTDWSDTKPAPINRPSVTRPAPINRVEWYKALSNTDTI